MEIDDKFLRIDVSRNEVQDTPTVVELESFCRTRRAIGIAANQLGYAQPWVYLAGDLKLTTVRGVGVVAIKPSYLPARGSVMKSDSEGCLSLPGRSFMVKRHSVINAAWTSTSGRKVTRRLSGFAAVVFQHEADHIAGKTIEEVADYEIK